MALNLIVAEGLCLLGLALTLVLTWPVPPWDRLQSGSVVGMVVAPLLFHPYSKTLWLAFDLFFRPVEPGDRADDPSAEHPPSLLQRQPVPARRRHSLCSRPR